MFNSPFWTKIWPAPPPPQWKILGSPPGKMLLWGRSQSRLMLARARKEKQYNFIYVISKLWLIMCIQEEQETYLLRAFLIIRFISFGSVVPCVEIFWPKPTTGNELFGSQWTSGHIRISKKDLDKLKGQNRRNWSAKREKKASTNKIKNIHDIIFSDISRFATQTFVGGWYCGVVTKIEF